MKRGVLKILLFHSSYFVTCAGFKDIEERKMSDRGNYRTIRQLISKEPDKAP